MESPMRAPVSRGEREGRSHAALSEVQRASWRDVPSWRRQILPISSAWSLDIQASIALGFRREIAVVACVAYS